MLQVDRLRNILGSSDICRLARSSGFCERQSKLPAAVFFDLMFYASSLSQNSSLEHLVSYLDSRYGIRMRKQSLDERFSEKTVVFVKQVLSRLIHEQFSQHLFTASFLSAFNHVRIKDSTKFNVPSNLAAHYRGCGGKGESATAGICIQYEFDLKTGKFLDLTLSEAVRNDQQDANETAENVCEGDLILRDLGYFSTSVLEKINKAKAFYLSRLNSSTTIYDENGVEIDFKKLYVSMTKNGISTTEKQVFMGKNRVPVRLVTGIVPPEIYQQRIRRKEQENKRKGRQTKERTKLLLHFNLFITNVEATILSSDKVMPLYRFRWQVELMFKNWKSVFSIHNLQKMKAERYITMLYIRLILIVINLQIIDRLQSLFSAQGKTDTILSYNKTLKTLKNRFAEILDILRCTRTKAIKLLLGIYQVLSKNHWREKRKNRENFIENICLFACVS